MCCTWRRLAWNAGPKKSPKNSPSGHQRTIFSGYIFATKAHKLSVLEFGAPLHISTGFGFWQCYCHSAQHYSSGRQANSSIEQRAPPIFGRAAITLGIGPHSSILYVFVTVTYIQDIVDRRKTPALMLSYGCLRCLGCTYFTFCF